MERRRVPDTESKLLLLDCLRLLRGASDEELLRFVTEGDWMNYITLQLLLGELLASGEITQEEGLYRLTAQGEETLSGFRQRIPQSRRMAAEELARTWRPRFRENRSLPARAERLAGDSWRCALALRDGENQLMGIALTLPAYPQQLEQRWRGAGQRVYRETLGLLLREGGTETAVPGARMERNGNGWTVILTDGELEMTLSLPEEEMARRAAARWDGVKPEIHALVDSVFASAPV